VRVGLVVPGFSADAADWCIPALRHLARTLARTDDVRVIAVRYPYRADRYAIDGAEVIALGGAASRGPAILPVWRNTLATITAEHQRRHFDVLHAFWATESGLLTALAGRLLRIPTLVSLAGGELVRLPDIAYGDQRVAWERLKVRASLRLASAVSAGSHSLMALAQRHVGTRRLHRAPLGVDAELFSPPRDQASGNGDTLLHVGTLTAVKDQATLLRAFAGLRLGNERATLEIVGDGPLRGELERLAHALGVGENVCFRGDIDHAALPAVYRAAKAFVLSSRHEAQGMVALEAAACGVPVVGTRVGVIPELTSAVVPVGSHAALTDALAAPPPSTVDTVLAEFGLQTCTDRFRGLYAELAGSLTTKSSRKDLA
jgi:glycosyltransferase involved in cell wall biosynthesis